MLSNIRTQVLIKLIKPYTRIQIPFISKELNIDESDVESLLVSCILDKWVAAAFVVASIIYDFLPRSAIQGRIDQVNHVLVLNNEQSTERYIALDKWRNRLAHLQSSIVSKV